MQVTLALWPGEDWPMAVEGQVARIDPGGQTVKARQPAHTSTGTWNHAVVKESCDVRMPRPRTFTTMLSLPAPGGTRDGKYATGMSRRSAPEEPAAGTVRAARRSRARGSPRRRSSRRTR